MKDGYSSKQMGSKSSYADAPIVSGAKGHKMPKDGIKASVTPIKSGFSKGTIDTRCND